MTRPYPYDVAPQPVQSVADAASPPGGILASGELSGQIAIADWFGQFILRPIDIAAARANRTAEMLNFIDQLGDELGTQHAARTITAFLSGHGPEQIVRQLGHLHVLLFEGIAGPEAISLCESSYAGEGECRVLAPFQEMRAMLRDLDVSVDVRCREPADHLAIELAALAEAMRQGKPALVAPMILRLSRWVPAVAEAVSRAGLSPVHTAMFALLDAFVADLGSFLSQGRNSLSGVCDV